MNPNAVFTGFEDIVNAFGINAPSEIGAFFSIQYDEDEEKLIDMAFSENMKECIGFFTLLLDEGIISIGKPGEDSDELFYSGELFCDYGTIEREEDLKGPYSLKLFNGNYDCHLYYFPSRYVYVMGEDLVLDATVEEFFNNIYLNDEYKLIARYGTDGYDVVRHNIIMSDDTFSKAPKLVGEFPDDMYKIEDDKLQELKDEISEANIESGYYKELTSETGICEIQFNCIYLPDKADDYTFDMYLFMGLFYKMLSEHFIDENRPTTEEFIGNYRREAANIINRGKIGWWFTGKAVLDLEDVYSN